MDNTLKVLVSWPKARSNLTPVNSMSVDKSGLDGKILYMWDIFDDDTLKELFKINGQPKYIFCDSYSHYQSSLPDQVYCVNAWLESELENRFDGVHVPAYSSVTTNTTANFIINKAQINRFLTIKLCEIFNVHYDYTWSGLGGNTFDLGVVIDEKNSINDPLINDLFMYNDLGSPVKHIPKKWITVNVDEMPDDHTRSILNYGHNVQTWNSGLHDIVSSSAVSLITESVWTQNAATFTEKTAYAMLGFTFPIWVGGVNMANEWEKIGFDIFSDVIDHSYQSMPTLIERCFYAFYLNREILTNRAMAKTLREQHITRLISNQFKLFNGTLSAHNSRVINTWPTELQVPVRNAIKKIA